MKIGLVEINKTIEDLKSLGYELKMADISYIFLLQFFNDKNIVYTILFGKGANDSEIQKYDGSEKIKLLKKYIKSNFLKKNGKDDEEDVVQKYADITFEENKDAMIKMIDELKFALDDGKLEYKDYAKMVTDLRTKLNDKFSVSEKQDEQRIIVYKKYNDICVCGREIYKPTKDDIMEDLMKEYDLVPKSKEDNI